jgi:hypothetical protein
MCRFHRNADTSTSDKLAQRNLAYIDGPESGCGDRFSPHAPSFPDSGEQGSGEACRRTNDFLGQYAQRAVRLQFILPGVTAAEIVALAAGLFAYHQLSFSRGATCK